jgi:hypothetical protein
VVRRHKEWRRRGVTSDPAQRRDARRIRSGLVHRYIARPRCCCCPRSTTSSRRQTWRSPRTKAREPKRIEILPGGHFDIYTRV